MPKKEEETYQDLDAWWSDMDEDYQDAEVQEKKFTSVPDGNYQVRVEEVKLDKADNGVRYLNWKFQIIAGEHIKQFIFKNNFLDPTSEYIKQNLAHLKTDLSVCGVELKTLQGLEISLAHLLDVELEVAVKSNKYTGKDGKEKTGTNVYINRKLTGDPAKDADTPF
jgi:hypothetical protein